MARGPIRSRAGKDRLIGYRAGETAFKADFIPIKGPYTVKVTLDYEEAGYRNSPGVDKVNPKIGAIEDASVMWQNASLKGTGGDLVGGKTSYEIPVESGEQLGFFLLGNGFSSNNLAGLGKGNFVVLDQSNKPATIDSAGSKLAFVGATGKVTILNGPLYHTAAFSDRARLNFDGLEHTMGCNRGDDGSFQIGFEDLWKGGDRDFDDCVFTVDIGAANMKVLNGDFETVRAQAAEGMAAAAWSKVVTSGATDRLEGGTTGPDSIISNQGNELLAGGGTGNDVLLGGEGYDLLRSGTGNDMINACARKSMSPTTAKARIC